MRIAIADCELDLDARQLYRAGEAVHLAPKAFDLLAHLVAQRPRAVPKQELYDLLWPKTFVVDANLAVLIREIRIALKDEKAEWIRTVHRHGYACAPCPPVVAASERPLHVLFRGDHDYALSGGENLVGRDPEAAVRIISGSVSRRHAVITVQEDSATVVDLESKNGTFVDGERLTGSRVLTDGALVQFGAVGLVYRWSPAHKATETLDS